MMLNLQNLVYFMAFLPFVNWGIPIFETDVQPFYLLCIVFFLIANIKFIKVTKFERRLILIGLIGTIYVLMFGFEYKKSVSFIALVIGVIFFQRNTYSLKAIRVVFIFYSVFFFLWKINPSVARDFQSLFVRNINGTSISFRGIPLLSTEPGLFAGMGVILIELYLLKIKDKFVLVDYLFVGLMAFYVVSSFSGTAIIFMVIFFLMRFRKISNLLIYGAILLIIPVVLINYFPQTRISLLFNALLFEGGSITNDSSVIYRISSLMVSLEYFISNPLGGLGVSSIENEIQQLYYLKYYDPKLGIDKNIHFVSSLGYMLVVGGVITLAFIVMLIKEYLTIKGVVYFLICASFSYSLLFPVSLILLIENSKQKVCVE